MLASMKKVVVAAGLLVGLMAVAANASDYGHGFSRHGLRGHGFSGHGHGGHGHHQPSWSWKTITVFETVRKPVVHYVTRYKESGTPYQDEVVTFRVVKVPVHKRIKVYH
jgi:hypothetical protein